MMSKAHLLRLMADVYHGRGEWHTTMPDRDRQECEFKWWVNGVLFGVVPCGGKTANRGQIVDPGASRAVLGHPGGHTEQ